MERILKHAFKGIALDDKSLRQMAMALSSDETDKETQETDEAELTMEEEECTIDPVEDTVARAFFSICRWRLFHARQASDRG